MQCKRCEYSITTFIKCHQKQSMVRTGEKSVKPKFEAFGVVLIARAPFIDQFQQPHIISYDQPMDGTKLRSSYSQDHQQVFDTESYLMTQYLILSYSKLFSIEYWGITFDQYQIHQKDFDMGQTPRHPSMAMPGLEIFWYSHPTRRCQIEVQVESGRRPKSKVSFQALSSKIPLYIEPTM